MDDFVKPTLEYSYLSPLFVVFALACLGVLVEAFVPRSTATSSRPRWPSAASYSPWPP